MNARDDLTLEGDEVGIHFHFAVEQFNGINVLKNINELANDDNFHLIFAVEGELGSSDASALFGMMNRRSDPLTDADVDGATPVRPLYGEHLVIMGGSDCLLAFQFGFVRVAAEI